MANFDSESNKTNNLWKLCVCWWFMNAICIHNKIKLKSEHRSICLKASISAKHILKHLVNIYELRKVHRYWPNKGQIKKNNPTFILQIFHSGSLAAHQLQFQILNTSMHLCMPGRQPVKVSDLWNNNDDVEYDQLLVIIMTKSWTHKFVG